MGGAQAMGGSNCTSCTAAECAFCRPSGGSPSAVRCEKKELMTDVAIEAEEGVMAAMQLGRLETEVYLRLDFDECQEAEGASRASEEGPRPPHKFRSGSVYKGQWRGCARHGFGWQTWKDLSCYEGQWAEGAADGQGQFTFPDVGWYIGQWRRNKPHGLGTYYDVVRKSIYRGDWDDGRQQGLGVEERGCSHSHFRDAQENGCSSGSQPSVTYSGSFGLGVKDGPGVCTWSSDGGEYCGQWREDHIMGQGVHTSLSKSGGPLRYSGQWFHSKKHGIGFYEWPDGRHYKGHYQKDAASGFGFFYFSDGKRYAGYWENAKQHGPGRMTYVDGQEEVVMWFQGGRADVAEPL
mmetsp:Transcript_23023/g.48981  ORF Transcript_23023/g.48981 Transcript_23023/m.48981 type:complete len:349 (+) Transcript_23023:88-1134(+)